jgi:hypothetical protein
MEQNNGTDDIVWGRQARNVCTVALLVDHAHPCWCLGDDVPVCAYLTIVHTYAVVRCVVAPPSVLARCDCSYYQKKHALPSWHGAYYPFTFILRPLSSWRRGTARLLPPSSHLR